MDIIELSTNEALKLVEFIKEHPNKKIKICKKIGLGHLGIVEVSTNNSDITNITD